MPPRRPASSVLPRPRRAPCVLAIRAYSSATVEDARAHELAIPPKQRQFCLWPLTEPPRLRRSGRGYGPAKNPPYLESSPKRDQAQKEYDEAVALYRAGRRDFRVLRIIRSALPTTDYPRYRQEMDSRRMEVMRQAPLSQRRPRVASPAEEEDEEDVVVEEEEGDEEESPVESTEPSLGEFIFEVDGMDLGLLRLGPSGHSSAQPEEETSRIAETPKLFRWGVRRGETWGVYVPNAAQNRILMSLLTAEDARLSTLPIRFFGAAAVPGRAEDPDAPSGVALRARIGVASPEIIASTPGHCSVRQVLESAWSESMDGEPVLNYDRDTLVNYCLRWLGDDILTDSGLTDNAAAAAAAAAPADGVAPHLARRKVKVAIERLRIRDLTTDELDWADHVRFADLSAGSRQVIIFVRAVLKDPELLVLKEPFKKMSRNLRERCEWFLKPCWRKKPKWAQELEQRAQVDDPSQRLTFWKHVTKSALLRLRLRPHRSVIYLSSTKDESYLLVQDWLLVPPPPPTIPFVLPPAPAPARRRRRARARGTDPPSGADDGPKRMVTAPQLTWFYGRARTVGGLGLHDTKLAMGYYPERRLTGALPTYADDGVDDDDDGTARTTVEPASASA